MWTIIKYNKNNLSIMKEDLKKKLGNTIEYYSPRFKKEKFFKNKIKSFDVDLLNNYIFCKHDSFKDQTFINHLKNIKGLSYFLNGYINNQNEINKFISLCKSNENEKGYLNQSFFNSIFSGFSKRDKGKFLTGPFAGTVFQIIERKGSNLNVFFNNLNISISKNSNKFLYSYI